MKLLVTLMLLCSTAAAAGAQGQVQDIAPGWKPDGLRRLPVAGARASSVLGEPGGQYAPARAVDGSRGTKWVASVAASESKPQWIVIELFGTQRVSAVALFGEKPGNDGVRDAQIQAAISGAEQFSTVATVNDARSGRWLATFDAVKASAVRLWITRSGGVSTHTDVYEIEVYGPPLAAGERKPFTQERLDACAQRVKGLAETTGRLALTLGPSPADRCAVPGERGDLTSHVLELKQAVQQLENQLGQATDRLAHWDALDDSERGALPEQAERLEIRAQQLGRWLVAAAKAPPSRIGEIEKARHAAEKLATGEKTVATRASGMVRLVHRGVVVTVDEAGDCWDATWLGPAKAAVRRAGFSIDAGGKRLPAGRPKAAVEPFSDRWGAGMQVRQRWDGPLAVERVVRVYDGKPAVIVSGTITNRTNRDARLGAARVLELSADRGGWWSMGRTFQAPAAVGYPGASLPCRPLDEVGLGPVESYGSSGVLALAHREPDCGLAIGFATAQEGSPRVAAGFRPGEGGTSLSASLGLGRTLAPGKTASLDAAWLSVEASPWDVLEHYGDAVAGFCQEKVRTGANSLWCSWYPIRMGISEENVLANAAVAAKHFRPLGLDIMQLDHGWQRGDVCGDWVPNQRFPHGLKWLSQQLESRYGMKLGLWIAPTQVAFSSQLFAEHPEWMIKNAQGKPATTGRWFWVPNPQMTVLDASHPAAEKWIEETFARLSAEGSCYYKIDFIAGSPVLRRAMEAIRRGAGPEAWIRYCQTPPLLSVGLANSAYIGVDTGDAGMKGTMDVLRQNAALLAASYWVNDRLYHREVCDMSVGMNAGLEEARLRLALMTLTGCSISFSDDLRLIEPPRIQLMQQCLPAGNPTARPLDLFERRLPSQWHMHCKSAADEWDVVGMFNFEDRTQDQTVDFARLSLPADADAAVYEFWEANFLGPHRRSVSLKMPPHSSRILIVRRLTGRPQVIATDMHVLGGYHEVARLTWDEARCMLSGQYRRAPGLSGKAYLYVPAGYRPRPGAGPASRQGTLRQLAGRLWGHDVTFQQAAADWSIAFDRVSP